MNAPKVFRPWEHSLLCFKDFYYAHLFAKGEYRYGDIEIWEINVTKIKTLPSRRLSSESFNFKNGVKKLWQRGEGGLLSWPPGTIGVTSLKLIKKIELGEKISWNHF